MGMLRKNGKSQLMSTEFLLGDDENVLVDYDNGGTTLWYT